MSAPIRLIAMDMDGTLLAPHRPGQPATITEECQRALKEAHAAGIHLCLSSGRMPNDVGFFAVDLGLPMHILSLNGGCCQLEPLGGIEESFPLSASDASQLWEIADRYPVDLGLFGARHLVLNREPVTDEFWKWGTWLDREGAGITVTGSAGQVEALCQTGVYKLVACVREDLTVLPVLRKEIEAALPQLEITSSWIGNLEINPYGVYKGLALRKLA